MELPKEFSYSTVANIVDTDPIIAADLIYSVAKEIIVLEEEIQQLQSKLAVLVNTRNEMKYVGSNLANHLGLKTPYYVKRNDCIVIVEENNMTINYNVL